MSNYLVTMKAQVPPDKQERLLLAFDFVMRHRPPGVVQSMLIRDAHDLTLWSVYTVWESHEALEAYYESTVKSGDLMPSAHVFHLLEIIPVGSGGEIIATEATVQAHPQLEQHDQNDAVS
jgi:quinol monooxygenase YgiN